MKIKAVILNVVASLSLVSSLCLTNSSKQKIFCQGFPHLSFSSSLTPESESAKVTHQKPTRCSLLSVKQMKYHDDTDQGQLLVVRRDFTVRYKNPKQGDRRITHVMKPIRSSYRSLQLKQGLISALFNLCNTYTLLGSLCNWIEVRTRLPRDSERIELNVFNQLLSLQLMRLL